MRTPAEWRKEKMDEKQKKRMEEIEKKQKMTAYNIHVPPKEEGQFIGWDDVQWLLSLVREQEKEIARFEIQIEELKEIGKEYIAKTDPVLREAEKYAEQVGRLEVDLELAQHDLSKARERIERCRDYAMRDELIQGTSAYHVRIIRDMADKLLTEGEKE